MWFFCLLTLATLAHGIIQPTCPKSSDLSPCLCDGEGINCNHIKDEAELKSILSRIGEGRYRGLWIQRTNVRKITRDMLSKLILGTIYFEKNDLETLESGALAPSAPYINVISVFENKLTSFPFADLKDMKKLLTFNAARNKLTAIPDEAFSGLMGLKMILLSENEISYIGRNAFNNIHYLESITLFSNKLTSLGPQSLHMTKPSAFLVVNLYNNQISKVDPNATLPDFSPALYSFNNNQLTSLPEASFAHVVRNMAANGGTLLVSGNPLSCKGCDYSWLVRDRIRLGKVFPKFDCDSGLTLHELTTSNINCI